MCLITLSRKGKLLDEERFLASLTHNGDGMGIMTFSEGTARIHKFMGKTPELYQFYKQHAEGIPHAFHHRFATHGNKNYEMLHPFRVLSKDRHGIDLYLMHNGVMSNISTPIKGKSDTWHFVHSVLRPMLKDNPDNLYNDGFKKAIEMAIGGGNKLVFLDSRGRWTVINRKAWTEKDDFLFSNTYSLNGIQRYSNPKNTNFYPYDSCNAWSQRNINSGSGMGFATNANSNVGSDNAIITLNAADKKKVTNQNAASEKSPVNAQASAPVNVTPSTPTISGVSRYKVPTCIDDLYTYNESVAYNELHFQHVQQVLKKSTLHDIEALVTINPMLCADLVWRSYSSETSDLLKRINKIIDESAKG